MELNVEGFDGQTYVVDVDVDDTAKDLRRKVATAVGFAEDSFDMGFGRDDEGEDINITALSAGDTVVLTRNYKQEAIAALRALGETDLSPERLTRVQDPKVARLFLQAEVVTVIPRIFLALTYLRSLDLSAPLAITAIDDSFLSGCESLTSIDFGGLSRVTSLGQSFLANCTMLPSIDFAGLGSVTRIGHCFLSDCTALASIDFSGLRSLTSLGRWFLSGCTELTSIDFAGLDSVTSLGHSFFSGCTALTSIDFAGLSGVTQIEEPRIGETFLEGCTSLETYDFPALRAIEGR